MTPRKPPPLVRILLSEQGDWFGGLVASLTHGVARLPIAVAAIVPPTIREEDLLETAAKQKFHMAILILNNILYTSDNRTDIVNASVVLVEKMTALFQKPIIAVYGWSASENYPSRLLRAGAVEVFQLPWRNEDMQQAIKRCVNIW
ncbi:MAG: hypothetical protein H3C27_01770 [Opitutaceae bacterium]|nr:hypothetical protein [Opitutaceae bacterium]